MWFKYILFYVWISRFISCDKSFTIVLDTTTSMQEELDVIKVNLPSVINAYNNTDISNYILVPFNDPDVGQPTVVLTQRELMSSLNTISVYGGQECPENSLAAIEKALQLSKPQSNIFVFTDAYSKDVSKFSSVERLCKNTRSQVVIFLSGFCSTEFSPTVNSQVYYDVAKSCSGAVIHFDPASLRQAFKYMKEVINVGWTDVISYDTFTEHKELTFTVDSFTKIMLLVASGDTPRMEISTPRSSGVVETIVDTRHTQVMRLTEPSVGAYTVTIRCRNKTSFVMYKKYELPVQFGFSTMQPKCMWETSRRPLPGRKNKILIDASLSNIKLETLEIKVTNAPNEKLSFEEISSTGIYLAETFIKPDKVFCIWVKGYVTSTFQEIKGYSENFIPQQGLESDSKWTKPKTEIFKLDVVPVVNFGANATFTCKVTGYPAPSITWQDDIGKILPSQSALLEVPSLYISYVSIENVTVNSTIYCKAKNAEGEDFETLDLYVYRPYTFDVIEKPSDQIIEYGNEGRLYCQVSAYPEAVTTWYHNDTAVTSSDDLQVDPETNTLTIINMTVDNIGEYKCQITNEANNKTYTAVVQISGIEAPMLEVDYSNITLKKGDWSSLECRIAKGKPTPSITWTFKSENDYEFGELPEGVVADVTKLKIAAAQTNHKGVYRCDAENIEGRHSVDITVQLQYLPIILDADASTLTVKEEDDVVLPCDVDASPAAIVRWEMSQDDVIVVLDDRHRTDHRHTHRFKALWKDSGNYHCIAENNIGKAEKTITVNVLVAPYIEAPKLTTVVARTGDNIVLTCNLLFGNPVPSMKWELIAPDSTTKILHRGNSTSLLHLNNVSYINEGSYLCIADNDIGSDSIKIVLKIQ